MSHPISIHIIGKGAFGTALATVYARAGHDVTTLGRDFPQNIDADYIFVAVPTRAVPDILQRLAHPQKAPLILCAKGILPDGSLPSDIVPAGQAYGILSGPGFADELARGLPTVHSIAAPFAPAAQDMASALSTDSFRLYWSNDPKGVQICGALKNILAIAAGMARGMQLGENAQASLIARGMAEIERGLLAMGGQKSTIWSAAGIGDLVLTSTSPTSRNFRFGAMVAEGSTPQDAVQRLGTVEGLNALEGFLAIMPPGSAPIAAMLQQIISGRITPKEAVAQLMRRPIKTE